MYIVEGNIGAGKSTFLRLIQQSLYDVSVGLEPLETWQSDSGRGLLEQFYQEPHRWAFTMEHVAMIKRVLDHMRDQETKEHYRIVERSIYSGHYCFAVNSYMHGFISSLEWSVYFEQFRSLIPQYCRSPRGFIYLRTDPSVCYERMRKRNRGAEAGVGLEYLQQIHERHESFLIKKEHILPELVQVPVLILDANEEFESNQDRFGDYAVQVRAFLHATKPPTSPFNVTLGEPDHTISGCCSGHSSSHQSLSW
jgi:deoxyadenosine/deoxycytidine kinase